MGKVLREKEFYMHYKAFLITKEFPTDDIIEESIQPFNGEDYFDRKEKNLITNEPYPVFTWDWYQVGGRYNSFFELDMDKTMDKYEWNHIKDRVNVVFRSYLFDKLYDLCDEKKKWLISEYKFYPCLGSKDNILRVDGGLISDMKDFDITQCYIIIDADGNAYARSSWNGSEWVEDKNFDDKTKDILEVSKDYYIVTVDIHD